jgi:hypothetical protein
MMLFLLDVMEFFHCGLHIHEWTVWHKWKFVFLGFTVGYHVEIMGKPPAFCLFIYPFQLDKICFKFTESINMYNASGGGRRPPPAGGKEKSGR